MQSSSISQHLYSYYVQKTVQVPTSRKKWEGSFNEISNEDWKQIFKAPWCNVSESRVIYLQFTFIRRIFRTNRILNLIREK